MAGSSAHQRGGVVEGMFPPTLWSVIIAAGDGRSPRAREALETLCRSYWYPLYAFVHRQGKSPHDAEDLTQAFFARLLEREALAKVDRERGRFRSFLLASLKNFIWDGWDKSRALKRGGGEVPIAFDDLDAEERYLHEPIDPSDPEKIFERSWAMTIFNRVIEQLEKEFRTAGKGERLEALHPFLLNEPEGNAYATIGKRLGMNTGAVKVAVLRLRQRYRELVRLEIAETVADGDTVEDELRHLVSILAA